MIEIVTPDGLRDVEVGAARALPSRLPILPLREAVPFPDTLSPLAVGQPGSIEMVNDVLAGDRMLVMVASRDGAIEQPQPEQLYDVGVVGVVARMMRVPDGTLRILVQGAQRVRIGDWSADGRYLTGHATELPDEISAPANQIEALKRNVQATFTQIVETVPYLPEELQLAVANIDDAGQLSNLIGGALRLSIEDKQGLLEEVDVAKRLRRLVEYLARELEVISIGTEIQSQVQGEINKGQREFVLRQQLKAIQEELGEFDEAAAEANELRAQLDAIALPEEVRKQVDRELGRLETMPAQAAEHGVVRTYLEWIASLPWDTATEDNLDLKHARLVLDADHYDIEQVKERVLEFLAVRRLTTESGAPARSSILCFVGPPGVGKTSLGRSIARAMERKFERISVGGVRDEAEIRGHRRTYIGAMPGVIIRALRDGGSRNPLFMIDEIDKMGADFRGDPSSAMLEVLDPEQNASFRDHYLDLPFDLSDVMFVCTANELDRVPGPLRDRMEIIRLAGYTEEEKLEIAKRYLVPRQIERNGLRKSWIAIGDRALRTVISEYTREAGVRQLEREIGALCRKVARTIAERGADDGRPAKASIGPERVRELLGKPRFQAEAKRRTKQPGVATGLAWTPVGGDVLFIEATAIANGAATRPPSLTLTGQLGDVMRESAQAALTWVRGHSEQIAGDGIVGPDWWEHHDIHLHVPAGATPKDGPSAGITMATALASLISGRCVRDDVAMTGEITLTGQVLPIGGLKEKALAAQRLGLSTVIAPSGNRADADEIPEHLRAKLEMRFVSEIAEVLEIALEPAARQRVRAR